MALPAIRVLALGGTIAMTGDGPGGVTPTLTGELLVAAVPGLGKVADVTASTFRQMPGAHLGFADLEALAAEIAANPTGADGFVVTQGTDTIEETAFALDRLLPAGRPVVVTGAMRNPTLAGADGPANLLAAVTVAADAGAAGRGVLVVLNDEIHAARFVRKMHSSGPDAFASPTAGPVGWVSEGQPHLVLATETIAPLPSGQTQDATVALIRLTLGDDGRLIDAAVAAGYAGLVVEGMGGGHAAPAMAEAIERATATVPVVLASRAGAGATLARTYGFPGGEIDLQRRGVLLAGWLDGLKARVLLTLALHRGIARDRLPEVFAPWN